MNQRLRCPLCLQPGSCVLSWDKRGRPLIKCSWCYATAFLPRREGLTSLFALMPQLNGLIRDQAGLDNFRSRAFSDYETAEGREKGEGRGDHG